MGLNDQKNGTPMQSHSQNASQSHQSQSNLLDRIEIWLIVKITLVVIAVLLAALGLYCCFTRRQRPPDGAIIQEDFTQIDSNDFISRATSTSINLHNNDLTNQLLNQRQEGDLYDSEEESSSGEKGLNRSIATSGFSMNFGGKKISRTKTMEHRARTRQSIDSVDITARAGFGQMSDIEENSQPDEDDKDFKGLSDGKKKAKKKKKKRWGFPKF